MTDTQLTRVYDLKTQGVDVVINDINKVIQRMEHLGQVKNSIFKAGTMLGVGEAFKHVNQEMQEQAALQMQILDNLRNINTNTERSIGVQERMAVSLDGILMKQKNINLSMADVAKGGNIQEKVIVINNELKVRQALVQEMKAEKEFAAALANQEKVNTEISKQQANATLAEAKAATEAGKLEKIRTDILIKLNHEQERLTANAEREAIQTAKKQTALYQLTDEYKQAAAAAKELAAQQVLMEREMQELGRIKAPSEQIAYAQKKAELQQMVPVLKEAQEKALSLSNSLHGLELAVGQGQRKVGQYNEVAAKLRDILRDTPAFAYSTGTGILGISNNIGPLYDALTKAAEANKVLKAAGEPTVSVFKQLGKELFSVQGLLSIGVAAVTIFAARMSMGGQATDKAAESLKKYKEALKDIDENAYANAAKSAAQLEVLNKVVKDTTKSETDRTAAIKEMQKLAPEQLSNLKNEAFLYGDITTEINAATDALYRKAAAEAAMDKFKETFKTDYLLMQEERKAQEELTAAKIRYNKLYAAQQSSPTAASKEYQATDGVQEQITRIQKGIENTQKERAKLQKEMQLYATDAQKSWTAMAPPAALAGSIEELQKKLADYTSTRDKFTNSNTEEGKAEINRLNGLIEATQKLIDLLQGKQSRKTGETFLKGINELFEANKRYDQAIGAQAKQEIEVRAAANKAIADNETKTLQVRMAAQQRYNEDMKALAVAEAQKDIAIINDKLKALGDKERLYLQGRVKLTKDQLAAIRRDEETFNILRGVKMGEMKSKELELEKSGYTARLSVVQAFTKAYKDEVDKVAALALQNMDTDLANKLTALANKGGNKEVQKKTAAELAIQAEIGKAQAVKAKVNTELPTAENTLAVLEAEKKVTTDLEKRAQITSDIRDLELEIARLKNQYANADLKEAESLAKRKEIKDADKKMLIGKLENGAIDIAQGAAEAEMAVLAARDAARDRSAEKQMSWNQKLLGAQVQSKAQQLANEKAYAAQQEEMAKEKAQRDQRRAKQQMAIEYAAAALKIVAANVWKGATGWAEIAVEEAILAGAYISKLAMLSAPAYAEGTGDGVHPGGPAIVGDGGRNEVVQVGDKYYITPATATPVDMPAGAKVFPSIPNITTMSTFTYPGTMGAQLKAPTYYSSDTRSGNSAEIQGNNQMADIVAGFGEVKGSIAMIMAGLQHMDVSLDTNKLSSKLSKNLTENVYI